LQNSILQAVQAFNGNIEIFDKKEIGIVALTKKHDKAILQSLIQFHHQNTTFMIWKKVK
jgi:hypothetical protein